MQTTLIIVATILISAAIFIPIGVAIRKKIAESKIQSAENEAKRLLENVKIEAENIKKEELIKAKEEVLQIRNDLDKEIKERRGDIQAQERRLIQKEENLEKRVTIYDGKEKELERKFAENEALNPNGIISIFSGFIPSANPANRCPNSCTITATKSSPFALKSDTIDLFLPRGVKPIIP